MGLDGGEVGFLVVGVVDAELGEDVQGVLPLLAGLLVLVQGVIVLGEPVVGASLILGVAQVARQRERLIMVGDGLIRVARGVP